VSTTCDANQFQEIATFARIALHVAYTLPSAIRQGSRQRHCSLLRLRFTGLRSGKLGKITSNSRDAFARWMRYRAFPPTQAPISGSRASGNPASGRVPGPFQLSKNGGRIPGQGKGENLTRCPAPIARGLLSLFPSSPVS